MITLLTNIIWNWFWQQFLLFSFFIQIFITMAVKIMIRRTTRCKTKWREKKNVFHFNFSSSMFGSFKDERFVAYFYITAATKKKVSKEFNFLYWQIFFFFFISEMAIDMIWFLWRDFDKIWIFFGILQWKSLFFAYWLLRFSHSDWHETFCLRNVMIFCTSGWLDEHFFWILHGLVATVFFFFCSWYSLGIHKI